MVDMAAIAAAAGALKTAFDISKTALELRDATVMHGKIIEMQREIGSALASAIQAQTDQMAMLKQVQALEEEIASLKAWDTEKERYELKPIGYGTVAYMLKEPMRGSEPPHWLCPNCYTHGKKAFLQNTGKTSGQNTLYACGVCQTGIGTERWPVWE
jgi:hypothetical protein